MNHNRINQHGEIDRDAPGHAIAAWEPLAPAAPDPTRPWTPPPDQSETTPPSPPEWRTAPPLSGAWCECGRPLPADVVVQAGLATCPHCGDMRIIRGPDREERLAGQPEEDATPNGCLSGVLLLVAPALAGLGAWFVC